METNDLRTDGQGFRGLGLRAKRRVRNLPPVPASGLDDVGEASRPLPTVQQDAPPKPRRLPDVERLGLRPHPTIRSVEGATPADALSVMYLLNEARLTEWGERFMAFSANPQRALQQLAFMAKAPNWFSRLYELDGKIVGIFTGYLEKPFFSDDIGAKVSVWYLRPEARGFISNLKPFREFIRWAKSSGAVQITYAPVNDDPSMGAVAKRLGFEKSGSTYWMDTNGD